MTFEANEIYHIYNKGNNSQVIFPQERNYIFFLQKMRKELLPYCSFLAYCLMPNHFHWLVYMKPEGCTLSKMIKPTKTIPSSFQKKQKHNRQQNMSQGIAILLRSYTRAINNQENRTGSLFQIGTKVNNDWDMDAFIHIDQESTFFKFSDGIQYARVCMNYIHQNPVKANLVKKPEDWLYSSASDYAGLRNGSLCNRDLASKIGLV